MIPRGDKDWNIHTSYHADGALHTKSHGRKNLPARKLQSPSAAFKGAETLISFAGYGPKTVGAICDPSAFSEVVEIPSGLLGPRDGQITVDLVQPGCEPRTAFMDAERSKAEEP
jgi:hypothetical protein